MSRPWRKDGLRCSAVILVVAVVVPVASGIAAATKAGAVPGNLVGSWRRNITATDWKKAGAPGYAAYAGIFRIVVKRSGDVGVYLPGGSYVDFTARFSVLAGGRLILDRVPACGTTKGLYRWKVAGRLLTLTKLGDKCAEEVGLFAGVWKRR